MINRATNADLLPFVPDTPRWIELRASLHRGSAILFHADLSPNGPFVVFDPEFKLGYVRGFPPAEAVMAMIDQAPQSTEVLAEWDEVPALSKLLRGWEATHATLYLLPDDALITSPSCGIVKLLDPRQIDELDLPEDLRDELHLCAPYGPIAVSYEKDAPAAFCVGANQSETLWDIGIDTLAPYRRRGHAAKAVSYLIRHFNNQGLRPVWGAEDGNEASARLAAKLGFVPADELAVFERREA